MAEPLKVTVAGAQYTLDIPADSTVVRAPVQVEFFTEVDRVSAIQREIGVDVTGQWDAATNEQFSLWLRVQQATHIGIDESDGWWGPKSEAALAGNISPDALKALSELRESGRLSKLTYRTDVHNASWEQVEGQVAERAASPNASAADISLSSTLNGEDAAPIVVDATTVLTSATVVAAGTAAYYAGRHYIKRHINTPDADNVDTPRRFTEADMDILPRSNDIEISPVRETLERPVIDVDYIPTGAEINRVAIAPEADVTLDEGRLHLAAAAEIDVSEVATAQDTLRVAKAEIDILPPPRTLHTSHMYLAGDASFMSAIQQFVQTFFPNLGRAFFGVAANSNEFISRAQDLTAKASVELDADADISAKVVELEADAYRPVTENTLDTVQETTFANLDHSAPDVDFVNAVETKAAAMAAQPDTATLVDVQKPVGFDPAIETAAREAAFNDMTSPISMDDVDVVASQAALHRIIEANEARIVTPDVAADIDKASPFLAERVNIAGAPDIRPDELDAMLHERVRQSLFDQPDIPATSIAQEVRQTVEFDPAIETAAREAAFNDMTSPASMDDVDVVASQAALHRIAEANEARIVTPDVAADIDKAPPFLAERVNIAGAPDVRPDDIDAILHERVRQSLFDQPDAPATSIATEVRQTVEFDPAVTTAAREAAFNDLTSAPVLDNADYIASQAALFRYSEPEVERVVNAADVNVAKTVEIDPAVTVAAREAAFNDLTTPSIDDVDHVSIHAALDRLAQNEAARAAVVTPEIESADPYTASIERATDAPDLEGNVIASFTEVDGQDIDTYFSENMADVGRTVEVETVNHAQTTDPYTAPIERATDAPDLEGNVIASFAEVEGQDLDAFLTEGIAEQLQTSQAEIKPEAILESNMRSDVVGNTVSYDEFDVIMANTQAALTNAAAEPSLSVALEQNTLSLTESFSASAFVEAEVPEIHYNIEDASDIYRAGTVADISALSSSADIPHLNIGHLSAARNLGNAFVGPSDIAIAGLAGAAVLSVSDFATAQRMTAEMLPLIGGGMAINEGRYAEGMMRFTEDFGGIGLTAILGGAGTSVAGPLGGVTGAGVGMVATIEISNGLRDLARTMGMDVDEGMDTRELTSFIGSLAPIYPQIYEVVSGLDQAERISVSAASVDTALRHSKYTMEGMSSEDAYARVKEDYTNEDASLQIQQAALIDGIAGIVSLTKGRNIADALADPESFSEIFRYYHAMETMNPDDPAFSAAVENLTSYNDIALQRTQLGYGHLMVERMEIAPELAALNAQGPRDEAIYIRYSDIIENYEALSPEQQEQYAWIKESADRYERREILKEGLTETRNELAENSRRLAHISEDIGHAKSGLSSLTSQTIANEQDALIAQMSDEFGLTADSLREDPSLIDRLEGRYNGSQDFFGSIWGNITDGDTYVMNDEEAGILAQFKGLEAVRQHELSLERSPVISAQPMTDIQLEIFRLLPMEETPDMSAATRMLVQAKGLIMGTEQEFANFGLEDAQDQIDFDIRRHQYLENIDYSEQNWRDSYQNIEMRSDRFDEVLQDLNIEVNKPDGATHVMDYNYDIPERAASFAM
jgi:hypothetical protein